MNEFKELFEQRYLSATFEYILETYCEESDKEAINEFLKILNRHKEDLKYAIVGGYAVSLWYSGARTVTPGDVDIKILKSEEKKIIKLLTDNGFRLKKKLPFFDGTWLVFRNKTQSFDVGIAEKEWDIIGIKKAKVFNYKGFKVKVIPPEYLIISKLFAGRAKDYNDVVKLLQSGKVDLDKVKALVKKYLPEELEEIKTLIAYAKELDPKDLDKLFERLQKEQETKKWWNDFFEEGKKQLNNDD